jgi:retinol dehydrogenase-13
MVVDATKATPGRSRPASEAAKMYGDNIKGKVFVITGAYSGIGVETTKALLSEGASKVVIGGRRQNLQDDFIKEMKESFAGDRVDGHLIDLGDLASVKRFAEYVNAKYKTIHVLINNAGVMNTPPGVTKDGFEQQMGINVIGHFLLSKLLIDKTKRQVWLSSTAHTIGKGPRIDMNYIKTFSMENKKGYSGWKAYQQSKLGNILVAKEFHKRYPNVETVSLHPGGINTNLGRTTNFVSALKILWIGLPDDLRMKSVQAGASTTVTCAALPSHELKVAGYYRDCDPYEEYDCAKNEEDMAALFDYCDEVTKMFQ